MDGEPAVPRKPKLPPIKVIPPNNPPELTPGAARALLKLMLSVMAKVGLDPGTGAASETLEVAHKPSASDTD